MWRAVAVLSEAHSIRIALARDTLVGHLTQDRLHLNRRPLLSGVTAAADERPGTIRVRSRKQQAEPNSFRPAEERRALRAHRVHDRSDVVHARLRRREPARAVGEADPALVEVDHAR